MENKVVLTKEQLFKVIQLNEQSEEKSKEGKTENSNFSEMIATLFHSQTQVHIFHLQTTSYAEHKALQGYYEGIDSLVDGLVESYQGKNELIKNYTTFKMVDYKSKEQLITYFKGLGDNLEKNRKSVKESYLQNQIDTVQELIFSTLYKLRFLN
jgi:hypothetical protein